MKNITTVILAAGRSTRFISNKSKLTHELAGYPIINHVFDSAKKISGKNIVVVCNKDNFEELKNILTGCKFVIQKNQKGTADAIKELGYDAQIINKVTEGRPHIVDELLNNRVNLLINTTEGRQSIEDSASIRRTALQNKLFCVTTIFGAFALLEAMSTDSDNWIYNSLQEIN